MVLARDHERRIERGEETAAARLSHDRGFLGAAGVIRGTARGRDAAISIGRDRAAFAIDRDIVEVEEISVS